MQISASTATNSSDPAPSPTGSETALQADAVPNAVDWDAPLIGGGRIDMRALVGQQVLLWFWAPY